MINIDYFYNLFLDYMLLVTFGLCGCLALPVGMEKLIDLYHIKISKQYYADANFLALLRGDMNWKKDKIGVERTNLIKKVKNNLKLMKSQTPKKTSIYQNEKLITNPRLIKPQFDKLTALQGSPQSATNFCKWT